jgi:hypothetical protein
MYRAAEVLPLHTSTWYVTVGDEHGGWAVCSISGTVSRSASSSDELGMPRGN